MFHPRYNALTRDVALISGSSSTIQKKKDKQKRSRLESDTN